ncbi:MAG: type IX secretion system membrane protein PorP/SprF [Bacteroidota bacterium]
MKTKLFIFLLLVISVAANAQQMPQLSQRIINEMVFNPAAVGVKPEPEIMLQHRSQWVGFDNAPMTQTFSYNGRMTDNMGLGGYLVNDITGPTRRLGINLTYAYHLKFEKFKVSLGLAGTVMQYGIDGKDIFLFDKTDPSIQENVSDRAWKPDASFGTYIYNDKLFAGISVMQLIPAKVKLYNRDFEGEIPLVNHYYFAAGYHVDIDEEFIMTPSFMFNTTFSSPSQLDINVKVDYLKKVFGALSYRYNDAVVLMAGIRIKQQFNVAYSYDIVTSSLRTYNSGSHEIVLSITIPSGEDVDNTLL